MLSGIFQMWHSWRLAHCLCLSAVPPGGEWGVGGTLSRLEIVIHHPLSKPPPLQPPSITDVPLKSHARVALIVSAAEYAKRAAVTVV